MASVGTIILSITFGIVVLVGTVSNILVCLVVYFNRLMRTSMNYLLVNLAISDMMLLVFFSPTFVFGVTYVHPGGETGHYLCLFITGETLAWMGGYASAFFLVAIAIERYYAVTNPHSYGSTFITKHLKLLVAACWLFAFAFNVSGFFTKYYEENLKGCGMKWPMEHSFKVYALMAFLTLGVVPCLTMAILYSRVIRTLWFQKTNTLPSNNEQRNKIQRRKATKMALSVSILYTACCVPQLTVFVISAYAPHLVRGNYAYPASVALVSLNSTLNPVLYSLQNNNFRRHLNRLVQCCSSNSFSRVSDVSSHPTKNEIIPSQRKN